MDELHESLQQLSLLRSNFEQQAAPPRRAGPLVPPKPKKGAQPLVPQSCDVHGVCKPSYAALIAPDSAHFYQNARYAHSPSLVSADELIYSNIMHSDLPPPPPMQHYKLCEPAEDEFPPPPSPVSSSYSELRRATDSVDANGYSTTAAPPYLTKGQVYANDYGLYGSQTSTTYESIYEPINPRQPSQLYSLYAEGGTKMAPAESEVDALTDLLVASMQPEKDQYGDHYGVCAKCGQRVLGETSGCTAMQQIYHVACFTCHHCQINLQGKPFYALDGRPYCEQDYLGTLEKCSVCLRAILERILRATGKPYHPQCFCCIVCGKSLDGIPFTVDATNQIHCIEDFHKKFAPRCCVCQLPIMPEPGEDETVRVVALDRSFHIACYKCEDCALPLSSEAEGRGCYPLDDHVLCKSCNAKRVQALTSHMTTEL